jgi:hypothetical protein
LDVLHTVIAAMAKGLAVMELEPMAFRAAATGVVLEATSALVALEYSTLDRGRDIA